MMTLEVADVTKPLASAGRISAKGHRIVRGDHDAYKERKQTGHRVKFCKKGNVLAARF